MYMNAKALCIQIFMIFRCDCMINVAEQFHKEMQLMMDFRTDCVRLHRSKISTLIYANMAASQL